MKFGSYFGRPHLQATDWRETYIDTKTRLLSDSPYHTLENPCFDSKTLNSYTYPVFYNLQRR